MINFISIKLIFSLITRCKKFIFSLNWSSYPSCYPWFWKTLQLASGNLFNWHMLVYYFILFTIKRGEYIINVIITICYYGLPINLIKILRKRIPIEICEVAHFSLRRFNSISCWSKYTKLREVVTYIRNYVATHWYTIKIIYKYIVNLRCRVAANSRRVVNGIGMR